MNKFNAFAVALLIVVRAIACDMCGSASSSFSLGMLPSNGQHFIGFRAQQRHFVSTAMHDASQSTREYFRSGELMGRFSLNKKIQLMAVLPYTWNQRTDGNYRLNSYGLGDLTVLGNYVLVNQNDSLSRTYKHNATLGFGVKAPTGNWRNDILSQRNLLPGTGSFDFIISGNYALQKGTWGYLTESSFTLKTANSDGYRFGNSLSTTHTLFYRWMINGNLRFIPQLGLAFSQNWQDRENGRISDETFNGSSLLQIQIGISVSYKKLMLNIQYFKPLAQQLNQGYVKQIEAVRLSLNYFINKKK